MKWLSLLLLPVCLASAAEDPAKLIGRKPPEWQVQNWFNSPPLDLADLQGKVVLIRWWTAPGCPYCKATAPALNEFHEKFQDQGLQVIGLYHHKSDDPLELDNVRQFARRYGFKFPVAVDKDWNTLNRWYLNHGNFGWTSVTFLLDHTGKTRYIHPGGEYIKGDPAYNELLAKIQQLLKELPRQSEPELK